MPHFLLGLFRVIWMLTKGHRALALENLALRQQLAIFKRQSVRAETPSSKPHVRVRTITTYPPLQRCAAPAITGVANTHFSAKVFTVACSRVQTTSLIAQTWETGQHRTCWGESYRRHHDHTDS